MGFEKRDENLLMYREELLRNVLIDLTEDPNVVAIYLSGSLAKGNADQYSDIDLHTIVTPETKASFIKNKRVRASRWGNVLFYEDFNPLSPVVVTHYDCFVKIDSWYHSPKEIVPSIWLRGAKVLYDPNNIITPILEQSHLETYEVTKEEVEFWKGKVVAFLHETYRAVMREEIYYALSNLDRVRWFVASGWYMEMDEHLDSSNGVWSKMEGKRSKLTLTQQTLLADWHSTRSPEDIKVTMEKMIPEILRLNRVLCEKVQLEAEESNFKKQIEMVVHIER